MAFTYGFYNSLDHDRKYNALQISQLFEGIINDGVFAAIGDSLHVTAGSGMTVNVGTGRAWFNKTWNNNDSIMPLTLYTSEAILNRRDSIVLEVGSASDVRTNRIFVKKGTPASSPVAPSLTNTTDLHQYALATIYVGAGVTSIVAGNITNNMGGSLPYVTVVGLDALLPEWQEQFDDWFDDLQEQMAGDVATNLQAQITALGTSKVNVADKASLAEAQAGTNDTKWMTPSKTASYLTAKKATLAEVQDGTNDTKWITPSKLSSMIPNELSSYMAFCANANTNALDAAFGKNNETFMRQLGLQLAMYAWFKGANQTTYPFTNLITRKNLQEIASTPIAAAELLSEPNLSTLIQANTYAKNIFYTTSVILSILNSLTTQPQASLANLFTTNKCLSDFYNNRNKIYTMGFFDPTITTIVTTEILNSTAVVSNSASVRAKDGYDIYLNPCLVVDSLYNNSDEFAKAYPRLMQTPEGDPLTSRYRFASIFRRRADPDTGSNTYTLTWKYIPISLV